jgi:hypothetical protein
VPTKEQLHQLIDLLPDGEIPAASRFLEFLVHDRESEQLADEDLLAVQQGQAEIARGEFTSLEDLKRELNL